MTDYNNFYLKFDDQNFPFIRSRDEAIKNIITFNKELPSNPEVQGRLSSVKKWYYSEELDMFAPSKFIGYKNNNMDLYLENSSKGKGSDRMDGRKTEVILEQFSDKVDCFHLRDKLEQYLRRYNKTPNRGKGLRIFTIQVDAT